MTKINYSNGGASIYDLIIAGAGAAGLFAGASLPKPLNGLILEKNQLPGRKLLISGNGQCNLTRGDSIKDFIPHYGKNGGRIRKILYSYNNLEVINFFQSRGIPLFEREDGKVFPASLKASDILSTLLKCCNDNGLNIICSSPVTAITREDGIYGVLCGEKKYLTKKLIIATGGCSYPITGSDGNFFPILADMNLDIVPLRPALAPVHVVEYPYGDLSGSSIANASITIVNDKKNVQTGDLLFAHDYFSGPGILNASRHATPGSELQINYLPILPSELLMNKCVQIAESSRKQLVTLLHEILNEKSVLPKRLIELICYRLSIDPRKTSSATSVKEMTSIIHLLTSDRFKVSGIGGYKSAMVTAGGVSLNEVHIKTLESKKYPGIYFAGEVLDVDGDTGGYNLQFAFSSAYAISKDMGTW